MAVLVVMVVLTALMGLLQTGNMVFPVLPVHQALFLMFQILGLKTHQPVLLLEVLVVVFFVIV